MRTPYKIVSDLQIAGNQARFRPLVSFFSSFFSSQKEVSKIKEEQSPESKKYFDQGVWHVSSNIYLIQTGVCFSACYNMDSFLRKENLIKQWHALKKKCLLHFFDLHYSQIMGNLYSLQNSQVGFFFHVGKPFSHPKQLFLLENNVI